MDVENVRPFGIKDKIGYLSGNFASDFTFTLCSGFFLKFYTDVMGVSAAIIGLLMMLTQFVDAFTDIGMGQLIDRSGTKKDGKYRPWIRRIAGPVAISSFLMYATWFRDMNMGFKVVWMFVTYLLYCSVFYTAIDIPYGGMVAAVSQDSTERASLANMRHIGGTLAMTVMNVVLPMVVFYTDSEGHQVLSGTNVMYAALACSIGAFLLYMLCYSWTLERVRVPKVTEKTDVKALIKALFENRAMMGIILVVLIREVANTGLHGMNAYIFPNYFGSASAQSFAGIMETILTLVMAMFLVKLAKRFGKREVIAAGSAMASLALLVAYFIHTHNVTTWLVIYGIVTIGLGIFGLGWALITDIIDDTELRTGQRIDGTIYGLYSFSRKAGQALSSGVRGMMLASIGYTASTAFDQNVLDGIYDITCLVPMIGFGLVAIVIMTVYPLSKKKVEENIEKLSVLHRNSENH